VDEVAQHPERRPALVRRRADDRDPAGGAQDGADPRVGEQWDGAATLLEIEVGDRPGPIRIASGGTRASIVAARVVLAQVAPSLTYGLPTAAGATLRPTTPARMISVSRYGSEPKKLL